MKNKKKKEKKKTILTAVLIIILIIVALLISFLIYVKTAFISKDEVKEVVLNTMNVNEEDVYFESIDLELDKKEYEVELYYNNNDYEFKVSAKEGKIIYTDYYIPSNSVNNSAGDNNNTNNNSQTTTQGNNITLDEAVSIALENANASENDVNFVKKQEDYDDNELVYDIEFHYQGFEYEYEIRAKDGFIISQDKDQLRRNGAN